MHPEFGTRGEKRSDIRKILTFSLGNLKVFRLQFAWMHLGKNTASDDKRHDDC